MRHALTIAFALALGGAAMADAKRIPVVIDTDIGADIDDAFALGLALASPEIEVVGITTVGRGKVRDPYVRHLSKDRDEDRAWLVCRFLTQVGVKSLPVAAGAEPQPLSEIDWQIQYRRHPAAIYNRTLAPVKEPAHELLARLANEHNEELVVISLGPLTNIARFIKELPQAARRVKRFVVMGGSIAVGYDGKPKPEPEWNIKTDIAAAKAVFATGLPITLVPLDATATLHLEQKDRERIFAARTPLTWQVQNLYELWGKETPVLFDPAAVMAAFDDRHFTWQPARIDVNDSGMTRRTRGKMNVRIATESKCDDIIAAVVDRLRSHGQEVLPQPPKHRTKFIDPGKFPALVHTFEDYETDIEKRWWMCGKLETKDVPVPGGRAMRAVLTQDFDDRQGDKAAMYRAVIFNPVPGPPMGPNTRLRFKYKLTDTDTIRVQLYSLSNGYHRYLSVSGLEQGKWLEGCVDMTQMRRPDGSGGPLAADERIDDIQFYVDPRAELLIDDIVLYDAAAEGETRPFPERIVYTGWFDTGKQGKEWPGDFEVVNHDKPRTWKVAKSVANPADGKEWIRVDIRGERKLDARMELIFKSQGTGAGTITLFSRDQKKPIATVRCELAGDWREQAVRFDVPEGAAADEIRFAFPGDGFQIDDVLLYVP